MAKKKVTKKKVSKKKVAKKKATKRKPKKKNWKQPEDMSDGQAKAVMLGRQCGAVLRSGSGYCKHAPVIGQKGEYPHRCKYHGGMSPGGPVGNQKARVHGAYSDCLEEGEEEIYEQFMKDGLDLSHEISIMKLRLKRALLEEKRQRKLIMDGKRRDAMEPDIERHEEGINSKGIIKVHTVQKKLPDMKRAIHLIVLELGKLIAQQTVLKGGNALSPEEQARAARSALNEMKGSMDLSELEGEDE